MTLTELQDHIKFVVQNNDQQADDSLTSARLTKVINMAIKRDWVDVTQHVSKKFLITYEDFTWTAASETHALSAGLQARMLYKFYDVTEDAPGKRIYPSFEKYDTLRWGNVGPQSARTVRAFYLAKPVALAAGADTSLLIPEEYHELHVWSAACFLRTVQDGKAPPDFVQNREEWLLRACKGMSARPMGDLAQVLPQDIETDWLPPT